MGLADHLTLEALGIMAATDLGDMQERGKLDRAQRGGSIGLVLLIAMVLVGAAIGLLQVGAAIPPFTS